MPTTHACCKAIIQEGVRKGSPCKFPPSDNGYCGRHQRNKVYDGGLAEGKLWCRFFFRGCDNTVEKANIACSTCKGKAAATRTPCAHDGCRNFAKEGKYCGKHTRDSYKEKETELGIKFCDIARGCFNPCPEGFTSCDTCRSKERAKENATYAGLKEVHAKATIGFNLQKSPGSLSHLCCYCGKEFISFLTIYNKPSRICKGCNLSQKKQDEKRKDRYRNYKELNALYPQTHFKQYFTSAVKRGYPFELTIEEFTFLVTKPCYYCGYFKKGEVVGIDRFDNEQGYILSNCRPCCEECNHMKYIFHPLFLIEKVKLLTSHLTEPTPFFERWSCYYSRISPATYAAYKASAKKRGLDFQIKREEFNWITSKPCYICGYKGPNGIDRKDNTKGYVLDNCFPCCYSCNVSKADIDYSKFIERTYMIASLWDDTSPITLPLPTTPPKENAGPKKRNHWKAAGLYTGLVNNTCESYAEYYSDVVKREEIESLRLTILSQPFEDAIRTIKTFLNTLNARKKRERKTVTVSEDIIHLLD
jgi:hypothetical protein